MAKNNSAVRDPAREFLTHAYQSEVELLQDAFFNFDEDKDFYLHLDELRHIVTADGEPMNDVEEFLAEASQFATDGYVDYRAFAQMMVGEDDS